jgi:hypothetical protein
MAAMSAASPLTLDEPLCAMLPLGIPLGWQPLKERGSKEFAVRRGGRFCLLDVEGHRLWFVASAAQSRTALIEALAAMEWHRDSASVSADIDGFVNGDLLSS